MPAPHAAHLARLRTTAREPGFAARDAEPSPRRGERRTWLRRRR